MNYEKVKYIMLLLHTIAIVIIPTFLFTFLIEQNAAIAVYWIWINAYFIKDQAIHSEPELHVLIHNHTQIHRSIRIE